MLPPPAHRPGSKPDAKTLQAAAAEAGVVLPDAAVQAFRDGRHGQPQLLGRRDGVEGLWQSPQRPLRLASGYCASHSSQVPSSAGS